jgi:hypothetical protein
MFHTGDLVRRSQAREPVFERRRHPFMMRRVASEHVNGCEAHLFKNLTSKWV